jgi:predicted molibdopterin-dependent oxidoreductase YjgC
VKDSRFSAAETDCILCGLCVRYCSEIKHTNAIAFTGRGITRDVAFIPEIANKKCILCHECFSLCPGGKLDKLTDGASFEPMPWEKSAPLVTIAKNESIVHIHKER